MLTMQEQLQWHKEHLEACKRNVANAKKQMDDVAVSHVYAGREKTREVDFLLAADLYSRTLDTLERQRRIGSLIGEVYHA